VFTVLAHPPLAHKLANELLKGGDHDDVLRAIPTPAGSTSPAHAAASVPDLTGMCMPIHTLHAACM
jgi:hypothetical protein